MRTWEWRERWNTDAFVSIPSKREGTCEHKEIQVELNENHITFQFPPNGKAHANSTTQGYRTVGESCVSIPSKREGTCERGSQEGR